jgi:hypothetical protein
LRVGACEFKTVFRIGLGLGDFLARELAVQDRIGALDALRGITVGDRLDLKRVQLAKVSDLIERQRSIVHQPNGGCLGHQWRFLHDKISCALRPSPRTKPYVISDDWKSGRNIGISPTLAQWQVRALDRPAAETPHRCYERRKYGHFRLAAAQSAAVLAARFLRRSGARHRLGRAGP